MDCHKPLLNIDALEFKLVDVLFLVLSIPMEADYEEMYVCGMNHL